MYINNLAKIVGEFKSEEYSPKAFYVIFDEKDTLQIFLF